MNGANHGQHLGIAQPFALDAPAPLPGAIATDTDLQYRTQVGQWGLRLFCDPGVLHSASHEVRSRFFYNLQLPLES